MINDIFAKISPFFEKYVFLKLFSISKVQLKILSQENQVVA